MNDDSKNVMIDKRIFLLNKTKTHEGKVTISELLSVLKSKAVSNVGLQAITINTERALCPQEINHVALSENRLYLLLKTSELELDGENETIYVNKTFCDEKVNRDELIKILEEEPLAYDLPVLIACNYDKKFEYLTSVFICGDECEALHLCSGYDYNFIFN